MKKLMITSFILSVLMLNSASALTFDETLDQIKESEPLFQYIEIELFTKTQGEYGYIYKEVPDKIWINTKTPVRDLGHVVHHELCGLFWWDILNWDERIIWYDFYNTTPDWITPYSVTGPENYFEEWCVYTLFPEYATIDINPFIDKKDTEEYRWLMAN